MWPPAFWEGTTGHVTKPFLDLPVKVPTLPFRHMTGQIGTTQYGPGPWQKEFGEYAYYWKAQWLSAYMNVVFLSEKQYNLS